MRKILSLISMALFFFVTSTYAAGTPSPIGYWKTIDDVTGKPKSILQITLASNQTVQGRVVKLFDVSKTVCDTCKGRLKNQPILGMTVMYGLKSTKKPNDWENGEIIDPKTGKVYNCKLHVEDNNQRMIVRGYLGLALFGRSQTWLRVSGA